MPRRPAPTRTPDCDGHKPMRSEDEAAAAIVAHLAAWCSRCRVGLVFRIWREHGHTHVGHERPGWERVG